MTERIFRYLREQQPETPCLVIDLDVVENNYRRMRELLPAAHIFYAVKANPAAQVLARLASAGSKFVIEAPYILPAAKNLGVAYGDVLNAYTAGSLWVNMIPNRITTVTAPT